MTKRLKPILNLLLLLCLVACGRSTNISPLLKKAEGYMNEKPDSALLLLDSITTYREDMSEAQNALWCLLYTQAQDKKRIEHTSDSLIQIAVKYYEKTNLKARKMQTYYYCGVVFHDFNDVLQAQEYYLKAYEIGKDLNEHYLLGRLCANLGILYTYQELYPPALDFQQKAVDYFQQEKDTLSLSMSFRNIARINVRENRLDSAITYYLKALSCTFGLHKFYMFNELADVYGRIGDYETGLTYARKASSQIKTADDSCLVSLTLGDLYLKSGKIDSAYSYLSFCRKSTNVYTLRDAYYSLSQLEKSRKDLEAYVLFQEQYEAFRDSIDKQTNMETLARLQSLYDYQLIEKKKEYYRQEVNRKTMYLYFIGGGSVLFLLLVVCIAFYRFKKRKEREELLNQSLRIQEQQYRDSQQYLAERENVIKRLEREIASNIQKRKESEQKYKSELEQKTEVATELKRQLDMVQGVIDEKKVNRATFSVKDIDRNKNVFFISDLYQGLCTEWEKLDNARWSEVVDWIDHILYLDFTYKIKMLYPGISETDLRICCLTRLDIQVGRMAVLLSLTSQAISIRRKRLYTKLTRKNGTAQDFDKYILRL